MSSRRSLAMAALSSRVWLASASQVPQLVCPFLSPSSSSERESALRSKRIATEIGSFTNNAG